MTEADWLACPDWRDVFGSIEGKVSDRKLRLFAVACCRAVWPLLTDEGRQAADVAERYADGLAAQDELRAAREMFRAVGGEPVVLSIRGVHYSINVGGSAADESALRAAKAAMRGSADAVAQATLWVPLRDAGRDFTADDLTGLLAAEMTARRRLLHDIVGDPFRPAAVDPAWLTSSAVGVARAIYDGRTFHDLPVLADALQDAGCDDAGVLEHCRGGGVHVRGCWVVDLVLGKDPAGAEAT